MHLCSMRMPFYTICGRSRSNKVILNIDIPLLIVFFKTYIENVSVVPEYENKIVGTIKRFGIPGGLPWHLTDEVYVPINCNGKFHWILTVVVLKERCIKVYGSMSSSRTNRKLCFKIQKLSTLLPKYLESSGFFLSKGSNQLVSYLNLTKERTNLTHSKSDMLLVLPNKQAIV
uniref:Ubiquitin-like protease family profile domain-containing protein n=1 Tax=Solanum tuberosum TaxID=4113 RepID=M1BYU8_SOLTU